MYILEFAQFDKGIRFIEDQKTRRHEIFLLIFDNKVYFSSSELLSNSST